jgi:hypothetical protein
VIVCFDESRLRHPKQKEIGLPIGVTDMAPLGTK